MKNNLIRTAACVAAMMLGSAVPGHSQSAHSQNFVKRIYMDLLGTSATPNQITGFGVLLDMQLFGPMDVATAITNTSAYRRVQVAEFYQTYLKRPATEFDLNYWVNGPGSGWTLRWVRAAILATDEYLQLAMPSSPSGAGQIDAFLDYFVTENDLSSNDKYAYQKIRNALFAGNGYTRMNAAWDLLGLYTVRNSCWMWVYKMKMGSSDPARIAASNSCQTLLVSNDLYAEQKARDALAGSAYYFNLP